MTLEKTAQVDAPVVTVSEESNELTARVTYAFRGQTELERPRSARIGCVIPAYNEQASIAAVLDGLLAQTVLPDVVHVIINNTTDDTFFIAREYAGRHERTVRDREMACEIFVHDVGKLPTRKVGALNIGFLQIESDCDYMLGVDGDTILEPDCVEHLLAELHSDSRIGGISAIYTLDYEEGKNPFAKWLIAGQRQQFASFNMLNLLRGRNMAVLGGQCSLFSIEALKEVRREYKQLGPWVTDSEVEDSLLSLQLKSAGFATKISARARASVGAMTTLKSLDAQQVKWNYGAIDLMAPGSRGTTSGQPFHPNMRLRWIENFSMFNNIAVRALFVLLLAASLSIGAFVFHPIWLIPPSVALLLNLRTALSMQHRNWRDILFAVLFLPSEIYLWVKMGHFVRSWTQFLSHKDQDNWGAQAAAERGKANNVYLKPLIWAVVMLVATAIIWLRMPLMVQEIALWFGWPLLVLLTVTQTLGMLFRLLRGHRGFKA